MNKSNQKAMNDLAIKMGYKGDYMSLQKAVNWVAENSSGGGSGIKKFAVDEHNKYELFIEDSKGKKYKLNMLNTFREHARTSNIQTEADKTSNFEGYFWKQRFAINTEVTLPLKKFTRRWKKGPCSVITENGEDIIRLSTGLQTAKVYGNFCYRWKPVGQQATKPLIGDYLMRVRVKMRVAGTQNWVVVGEYKEEVTHTAPMTDGGWYMYFDMKNIEIPDKPCDIKITINFVKWGNNPDELTNNDFRFGVEEDSVGQPLQIFKFDATPRTSDGWVNF